MSGPGRAEVSVVVPVYESGATVGATVASALEDFDASGIEGEVVVVNDGSTDRGPAIVEAMGARDGRVRLIHRTNGGLSAARNTGLAHARGRFVRFLDADDLAVPGGLGALVDLSRATGAACGGQELIDASGRSMGRELSPRAGPDRRVGLAELASGNAMGVGAVLVARDLIGDRRFDESLPVCEDWDLWLRMAGGGVRFAALPAWIGPVKRYRVRAGSLSKRFDLMLRTGERVLGRIDGLDVRAGLLGLATGYGAMRALAGDARGAVGMLPEHRTRPLSAAHLAADAFGAVLLGLGVRPESRGPERRAWVANLAAWWEVLIEAGWTDEQAVEHAWAELSRLIVSPGAAACACVKQVRAGAGRSAVVVGLGKNGRRVLGALGQTPLAWTVRDDALADARTGDRPASWRPMSDPVAPDAAVIVTPERDGALVARVRALGVQADRIIRWSDTLDMLSAAEVADLHLLREQAGRPGVPSRRCA